MNSVGEGLLLEDRLPLSIKAVKDFPGDAEWRAMEESNELFLRANVALHDFPEADDHDELKNELRRQDLKIRLLLTMVGDLLVHYGKVPEPASIRLTPQGLQCAGNKALAAGKKVAMALYIDPALPKPLRFYGTVDSMGEGGWISIRFQGVTQPVQDMLEKVIFRHHRKSVAKSRSNPNEQ